MLMPQVRLTFLEMALYDAWFCKIFGMKDFYPLVRIGLGSKRIQGSHKAKPNRTDSRKKLE